MRLATIHAAVIAACALMHGASAQHSGDVLLENEMDQIVTGAVTTEGELDHNVRVFRAAFGESPNFTNDPGYDTEDFEFAPGTEIGFTIRKAVRKWNGADFDTIAPERFSYRLGNKGPILSPLTDDPVPGFSLAISSNGRFHHHIGVTLQAPASNGVYLAELELWSTAGIQASRPYWIVYGQNAGASDLDDATQWVYDTFLSCSADFNGDGFVSGDDFDAYVTAFEAGSIIADFNDDGFVTGDDFDAFVSAFEIGC